MTIEVPLHGLSTEQNVGWMPLSETNLLILVGVTGVGKTTTVNALARAGLSFALLPNRRPLTDQFIISRLQRESGEAVVPVKDRTLRFDFTRRYREQFPGGMAHTIGQLFIDPDTIRADWLIFDGLRGQNEVQHAARLLPTARFLVLDAPDIVRLQRLLGRNDAFDQVDVSGSSSVDLAEFSGLFGEDGVSQLETLVAAGEVEQALLEGKIAIVQKERENYDPFMTRMALRHDAPDRSICVDTAEMSPDEAATYTLKKLWGN